MAVSPISTPRRRATELDSFITRHSLARPVIDATTKPVDHVVRLPEVLPGWNERGTIETRGAADHIGARGQPTSRLPAGALALAGDGDVGGAGRGSTTGIHAQHTQSKKNVVFETQNDPKDELNVQLNTGGPIFSAQDVTYMSLTRAKDGTYYDATFDFSSGEQVTVRFGKATDPLKVRFPNGDWHELPVVSKDHQLSGVRVEKDGNLTVTTTPRRVQDPIDDSTPGPLETRYQWDAAGGKWKESKLDFTTQDERKARVREGAAKLGKGDLGGFELVDRGFAERVAHDEMYVSKGDFATPREAQRLLGGEYGKTVGEQVAKLHAAGKTKEAEALQAEFMARLYSDTGPIQAADARAQALGSYAAEVLQQGEAAAVQLLPQLHDQIPKHGSPSQIYLDSRTSKALMKMADELQTRGERAKAQQLFEVVGKAETSGSTQLLAGNISSGGTLYLMASKDGKSSIELGDMGMNSGGLEVQAFAQARVPHSELAAARAKQLAFSATFKAEATALRDAGKLTISDAELDQVPPTPEVMQKYLAAKYDGKMPKQIAALRKELGEYLEAAFVHPRLDVPDSFQGWKSNDLAVAEDGRLVGDCLVMNRVTAHMLSGIGGLELRPIEQDGHTRLMVTGSDGEGFIQSNQAVVKLKDNAKKTIAANESLQVDRGMPAPIIVGPAIKTGAKLVDVDQEYDASRATASAELLGLKGDKGALRDDGRKVSDLMQRYDAFRQRAHDFYDNYYRSNPNDRAKLEPQRQALAQEHAQLERDLAGLKNLAGKLDDFVKNQKTSVYGAFAFSKAATEFLTTKTPDPEPLGEGSPFEHGLIDVTPN